MKFYAKSPNLMVQITAGGYVQRPNNVTELVQPRLARFSNCEYETTDQEEIDLLLKHPHYGRNKDFYAESDRPEAEKVADRLARLEAENAALKARLNVTQVVEVPVPAPPAAKLEEPEATGLDRLKQLKEEAKSLGITVKRDMGVEDLEEAIAKVKGAQ